MERVYQWLGASRQALLLRLLARVHWGLVGGTVCVVLSEYLRMMGLTRGLPVLPLFLRGLLFGIPVALSFYAETRLPAMWQFLLAAVGTALVSWGLLGHLGGLVMGAVLGFFRLRRRLHQETKPSAFEAPNPWFFILFLYAFGFSVFYHLPLVQKLAAASLVLDLLLYAAGKLLGRLDHYLEESRDIYGLPARRILRTVGAAVGAGVLLGGAVLLVPALLMSGELYLQHPEGEVEVGIDYWGEVSPMPTQEYPDYSPPERDSAFPGEFFYLAAVAGGAVLAAVMVRLCRSGRRVSREGQDVIERLGAETREGLPASPGQRQPLLDLSPSGVIRRRYRKVVRRAKKEAPKPWQTPGEIEADRKLQVPGLHRLYEKARYSTQPCTREDVRAMKQGERSPGPDC